ncbi:NUDIX domain-containing protein [Bacillus lacus]|uniref:NUDIX domain-containing protein n=1 Tax=Metabacillus lacus TaxID=1983721 RepID=A0A7X2J345_9BACI|nr:NUDIX hydrolase [Metabacillus lacus]MRX73723.1 NUDIX domain-containing protein [Metabacillus lacus]
MSMKWLEWAKEIQSIAQAGLEYSKDMYDIERFHQLRKISADIMSEYTEEPMEKVVKLFTNETGYQTPKVDVRGVIFKEGKILLVKEKLDGCWSIPGGWGDIGFSPSEVAVKEIREETGFESKAVRLLGVLDKKCHPHPPSPYHTYKIFILCSITGGQASGGMETEGVGFFAVDELPELSVERNTENQIQTLFEFLENPERSVLLD